MPLGGHCLIRPIQENNVVRHIGYHSVSGLPDLFFLTVGYFLSLRPSSALLDKHEKAANSRQCTQ